MEETGENVLELLQNKENYPVNLRFGLQKLTSNDKIIMASTFHTVFAFACQVRTQAGIYGPGLIGMIRGQVRGPKVSDRNPFLPNLRLMRQKFNQTSRMLSSHLIFKLITEIHGLPDLNWSELNLFGPGPVREFSNFEPSPKFHLSWSVDT